MYKLNENTNKKVYQNIVKWHLYFEIFIVSSMVQFNFDTRFMIYRFLRFNSCLNVITSFILFYLSDLIRSYQSDS
jgi:hypothetical protein